MQEKKIECLACQATGVHSMPPMVNISAEPAIKERLLTGSFFEWVCPGCSRRYYGDDVLLCCNPDRNYCVYLVPGYSDDTLPIPTVYKSRCKGTLRVALSFVDFVEKLRIFEAGLDDRVIEAMKSVFATVSSQSGQPPVYQMLFEEISEDGNLGFFVQYEEDEMVIGLPREAYDRAAEDFGPLFPKDDGSSFVKVDQSWFESSLQAAPEEE
jgi:hypothetical protein